MEETKFHLVVDPEPCALITMKLVFVVFLCVISVMADPIDKAGDVIQIVESQFENNGDGNYEFKYKGSDGSAREEHGELRSLVGEDKEPVQAVVVTGEYSWTSPEGQLFTLKFVSDENGFRPVADHLPQIPKQSST